MGSLILSLVIQPPAGVCAKAVENSFWGPENSFLKVEIVENQHLGFDDISIDRDHI